MGEATQGLGWNLTGHWEDPGAGFHPSDLSLGTCSWYWKGVGLSPGQPGEERGCLPGAWGKGKTWNGWFMPLPVPWSAQIACPLTSCSPLSEIGERLCLLLSRGPVAATWALGPQGHSPQAHIFTAQP